jgi:hypothetical protein
MHKQSGDLAFEVFGYLKCEADSGGLVHNNKL